jgi:threonine dehydrogenase-like Zn-dependent dehydrogenase
VKALVYDGSLKLVPDYPDPRPAPGEALVKVSLAGICQTDIEVTRGYMEFRGVLGHEFVGVVESCGGAAGEKLKGRRVVGEINCVCGKCEMCGAGLKAHCFNRTTIGLAGRDGCLAERLAIPASNLHTVPAGVPDEAAVFVEPLAAAFQVVQQVRPDPKAKTIVIGDGRLGQLVAQVLASRGVRPLVIGKSESKLRRLERLGISALPVAEARPRKDAHLVVEASGSTDGLVMAMAFVRPRGTIVLKSTLAAGAAINLSPLVVDEITVLGSRCGPFSEALGALGRGEITTEGLITAEFPLDKGLQAFEAAQKPEALKVVIRP